MVLNPNFFLPGTDHSLKVQSRMEDKVRNKNLKSLLVFFGKCSREEQHFVHIIIAQYRPNVFIYFEIKTFCEIIAKKIYDIYETSA